MSLTVATLLMASCGQKQLDQAQLTNDSLQEIVNARDAEISSLFDMLNQIEDNLAMISAKYSSVQELKRGNTEANYNVKGEITTQINSIEEMMAANKKKISELNARIGSVGKKNTQIEAFVAKLEERVAAQESQISNLLKELEQNKIVIENLNQNVTDLTSSNQQKDETIAKQTEEANRAYFIVGTYNELKELGIVNKTGGFIGIGRKQMATSDMNTENFTMIDRTQVTTITINKKKAMVISNHPANSYELVNDDNDDNVVAYLRILNPSQFWQYTKFLVISTK